MRKQALLVVLVGVMAALPAYNPAAAAQDAPIPKRIKERKPQRPQLKSKRVQPKAAAPKPALAAAPKPSTDTESFITKPGDHVFSIQHGGLARSYLVHVPTGYSQAVPAPLVVALHGGGGSMDLFATDSYYGLTGKSDREGFVAVFPNGFSKLPGGKLATWNAGGGARDQQVDDVGFIRQVVTNVFRQMSIDRSRIYAAGMSNGAMMSYRLACEMPEVFSAIVAVAGTDNNATCKPTRPISVLHIHAKNDSRVLFNGGSGPDTVDKTKITDYSSVPATVSKWAQLDGCAATPRRILDTGGAYCEAHSWCQGKAEVQLCVTETGGHTWPGGTKLIGEQETPSRAISATDLMWSFFSRR